MTINSPNIDSYRSVFTKIVSVSVTKIRTQRQRLIKKMKDNMEVVTMSTEQKKVIEELEEVLSFLKNTPIKNEAALVNIKKPLEDLQSSLKYLPTEPSFEMFPSELKRNILSYLCDSNAFTAASVCLEWKEVLENRFRKKTLVLGKSNCSHDSNSIPEDRVCSESKEMLKASATHKLDVHLKVLNPLTEVDSKLVTDGLLSAKSFTIDGEFLEALPLTFEQLEDLFERLEQSEEIMEHVDLSCLDLTQLNQDRLVHCFLNKIKSLRLDDNKDRNMFNVELFIRKLSEESIEFKLSHLSLGYLDIPDELSIELATALCNVESVQTFYQELEIMKQLIQNILTRSVKIKKLISLDHFDYSDLMNPEDLKRLLTKMTSLRLEGTFTSEQREAAKTLPDVNVILFRGGSTSIEKGVELA